MEAEILVNGSGSDRDSQLINSLSISVLYEWPESSEQASKRFDFPWALSP